MFKQIRLRSLTCTPRVTRLYSRQHSAVATREVWPTRPAQETAHAHAQRLDNLALAHAPPEVKTTVVVDPFKLLAKDLDHLRTDLLSLVPASHPELTAIARYYFESSGKHLRPVLILLFAKAANGLASGWDDKCQAMVNSDSEALNRPLSPPDVLTDYNPMLPQHTRFSPSNAFSTYAWQRSPRAAFSTSHLPLSSTTPVLPTQRRLAQITEMIHVASLLHDDVIDKSDTRRSRPSAPAKFGNKLSILGGDFLLARASAALARLGDLEVVELVSSMINNLVEGEIVQLEEVFGGGGSELSPIGPDAARWNLYLKKSYLKTASLMAKSARASVVLGGALSRESEATSRLSDERIKDIAYLYGRNIGIAFQLVDDMLDFSTTAELGKPSGGADMQLGLTTAPALFAWEEEPKMGELICRRFSRDGDVEMARAIVTSTSALQRTRDLASSYANAARDAIRQLPESEARLGLETLCNRVVARTK
ncbi:decaprenyl-diphosphate synthase protein [Rhizoctonia solani 123E]|uniref:(2E,6E)-farnesyl diphosphate synthase n=1 Tax=Rhizoctonia solani 123E TaxID=1423351 RepID=A0A074RZZ8_9AGAM|nr:decaprenyl-diphosphate synthase protein [Rhizoctonia solani 123E]